MSARAAILVPHPASEGRQTRWAEVLERNLFAEAVAELIGS